MNQFQSFGEVLSALRRRAVLILGIFVLGCAISLWFAASQGKLYEATAVVQIEESRVPETMAGTTALNQDAARRVRLIEQRLMSRDNLVEIMDKHDLFTSDPDMTLNERVFRMRESARIEQIRANPQSYVTTQEVPSGLLITVTLDDAQKAADVANELMYTVIDQSRNRSVTRARETLSFFDAEEARVAADIDGMAARIADYKQQNANALPTGVTGLRDQLATLQDNELELDREIVAMEANSSRQRAEVLSRQITLLREQKELVGQRIVEIEETIRRAPEVERELSGLERQLTQLQEQYGVITRRKADAEMGQMLEDRQSMDRFEVLETALVPEVTSSKSRKKLLAAGAVGSLIAGLAIAFIAELSNPVIRSAAQLERALGMQPVVAIPEIRTRRDRRRRGLGIFVSLGLVFLAVWGLVRVIGDTLPLGGLFQRVAPGSLR
ncbi:hypothetical protein GCM10011415_29200 [Salipiger pallidus]|uniref:Polysaccharide chain length determinant protein, PEP-CTERM locus subfamily n=1 Tax=Salipiger pallidus TaxID=1775170 RepID=A0A8J2ZL79_9RHOB|nr:chain-length determining protein [Salipiger pallidus]GGG78375.1 hypothetical protein GCM10011415_29200 [Salipiger pallidus]